MDELMKVMYNHLNQLEIKGEQNIVRLASCMSIVKQLMKAFEQKPEEKQEEKQETTTE